MKKASSLLVLFAALFVVSLPGCGGHESQVIEVPDEPEQTTAIEGMDDDEYNRAMNESLNQ